jgi:GH15 family glucan-1,4-alpha-glucosidase
MSSLIEDYALLGDCHGAGLVSKTGSIDWLCVPSFDAPACFAALLGNAEHGRWLLAPEAPVLATRRHYRGQTLVLETEFETSDGRVAVIDCMPPNSAAVDVVRVVEGRRGTVRMQMDFVVRFDYGHVVPWVTREDHSLRAIAGPNQLRLHTPVEFHGENLRTVANFEVSAGERVPFVVTFNPSYESDPPVVDPFESLAKTEAWWSEWSARSTYEGQYHDAVQRSLIVLKALTYRPSGGIVAAPTTSLPECLGGQRNWDYRFCWLRDATIALYALLAAGYTAEAKAWREWLLRAVAGSPAEVQVIYAISGDRRLQEWELPWLPGYENSRPVRAGNAAYSQLQLDIFGELMDTMHQCRRAGLDDTNSWALERNLLDFLADNWMQPDEGIWEVRGPRRHFTHSKIMSWVAFDRAVKSVEEFGLEGPVERWRALRDQIHREVCERAFSKRRNAFVQAYDAETLDASALQIPLVGFLPASDARVKSTIEAIERELLFDESFVRRYEHDPAVDGIAGEEGAFLACSFWLVNARVLLGQRERAEALFERLLALRNDLGLLSEEYDYEKRRLVGNFPQAFSHLALIDAAQALSQGNSASLVRSAPRARRAT